ncbi:MAG: IS256 family transposase [Desulfobacteraceae bacterium]|nr:IS256 family transposase [Desulfobacteraceae bacterium]
MSRAKIPDDLELQALAKELAKNVKSQKDLSDLTSKLVKMTVEAALSSEMEEHLGYTKNSSQGHNTGNNRNGHSRKRLIGDHGEVEIETPRDRNGQFEPQLVKKGQTRLTHFDDQILSLYAKGMSTRDIVASFKEMYGADVSATLISKVTESVIDRVIQWQNRPLDAVYPIVYLDCIVVKIRQNKRVINKSIYLALGVNLDGTKEVLGLWLSETEGAKFWLSVLTELQTRGLDDIFIACVDGLKGFPDAIEAVFPHTQVQLCIVHMVRNSLRYVSWKERKAVATDLKAIYQSVTVEEAELELDRFGEKWDGRFPYICKSWRNNWANLTPLFNYPENIRKAIYTTNAIESLNSVIRKNTKNRKIFPGDESALKVVYLAIEAASKKWTMPIHHWKNAMNHFMIEFPDRVPETF